MSRNQVDRSTGCYQEAVDLCKNRASLLFPSVPYDSIEIVTSHKAAPENPRSNLWRCAVIAREPSSKGWRVLKHIEIKWNPNARREPFTLAEQKDLSHQKRRIMVLDLLDGLEADLWKFLVDLEAPSKPEPSVSAASSVFSDPTPSIELPYSR